MEQVYKCSQGQFQFTVITCILIILLHELVYHKEFNIKICQDRKGVKKGVGSHGHQECEQMVVIAKNIH